MKLGFCILFNFAGSYVFQIQFVNLLLVVFSNNFYESLKNLTSRWCVSVKVMADPNNVEFEAAKLLQKLIHESKDEPSQLATKLYVVSAFWLLL